MTSPPSGSSKPGEHAQQRGLAGAVGTAQPDAVAVADVPGDGVEQHPVAEALGE